MTGMRLEHLSRLDLNLLLSLHVLLDERSVSRAAARVGLSQPAMSRALTRLRDHLGDPLLLRSGRGMTVTPRAEALAAPLRALLGDLEALLGRRPTFHPPSARRTFRLATADYGAAVLIPPLVRRLAREAPGATVEVHPAPADLAEALEAGRLDVVVIPRRAQARGLVWRRLFTERFVCAVRAGHPLVGRKGLTLDAYCELGHVVVTPSGRPGSAVDEALARHKRKRRVVLQVASFLVAPLVVASSDLIVTTPARIARQFADLRLALHPPPLSVPGFTVALGWHERFRGDPAHAWFRGVVAEVGHGLADEAP
jgi:DNA-binding transcriptional LysR family regulator